MGGFYLAAAQSEHTGRKGRSGNNRGLKGRVGADGVQTASI